MFSPCSLPPVPRHSTAPVDVSPGSRCRPCSLLSSHPDVASFVAAECSGDGGSVVRTLCCLFLEHTVRVLAWGSHPLSILTQRLCCAVQGIYGPLGVHQYALSPGEAREYGMADVKTTLARIQVWWEMCVG